MRAIRFEISRGEARYRLPVAVPCVPLKRQLTRANGRALGAARLRALAQGLSSRYHQALGRVTNHLSLPRNVPELVLKVPCAGKPFRLRGTGIRLSSWPGLQFRLRAWLGVTHVHAHPFGLAGQIPHHVDLGMGLPGNMAQDERRGLFIT